MPTPDTKLLQGTLGLLILKALSLGPLHGYGVGQRIMQMSEDALRVEEGSL
jgi:DNA-binding PadR family transcriptional regulator